MIKRRPALPEWLRATLLEVGTRSRWGPDVNVVTVNMRVEEAEGGGVCVQGALIYEAQVETSLPSYGSAVRA